MAREKPVLGIEAPKKVYSVSGLRTFSSCPRLYFYQYGMRITPSLEPIAFIVGRAWQDALIATYVEESVDAGIEVIRNTFASAQKKRIMSSRDAEELEKIRAATEGMMAGFVKVFLNKDLKRWEFIEFEREFQIKMPGGRVFHGFLDELIRLRKDDSIWIVENKTASRIDPTHTERPLLDIQDRGYFYASSRFLSSRPAGVIHFVARKSALRGCQGESFKSLLKRITDQYTSRPMEFFYRKFTRYGPNVPSDFEMEFTVRTENIEHCWEMFASRGPKAFSQNSDYCFIYNRCPFWNICTRGINKDTLAGFVKRRENR